MISIFWFMSYLWLLLTKLSEIGFFGEYVGNVGFSTNILDCNSIIGDPFTSCILGIFNVVISCGGHIVTPFDTRIIVIVENSGICDIVDWIPQGGEIKCKPIFVALISALQKLGKVCSC